MAQSAPAVAVDAPPAASGGQGVPAVRLEGLTKTFGDVAGDTGQRFRSRGAGSGSGTTQGVAGVA